ncbi:MAG: ferritin family protein [Desulfoprunum sp.]|uniref:ferritin-like domain-containing protein n=1 Tax=Desulfoprunum sp. TaxID=2020866 RepID=UPI003C71A040
MNAYDFAMQMERDGEKFYSELAGNTQVEGIRTIMTMLAGEEVKHYNTIALLKKQAGYTLTPETEVLGKVKNIFLRMKDEKAELRFDSSELESYRKARDIEEVSRTFYLAKAAETQQKEEKQIFLSLASEEEKHLRIMENIVEFVARPEPGYWLENAEWHHLEEY